MGIRWGMSFHCDADSAARSQLVLAVLVLVLVWSWSWLWLPGLARCRTLLRLSKSDARGDHRLNSRQPPAPRARRNARATRACEQCSGQRRCLSPNRPTGRAVT